MANRASRVQGRAFLATCERAFPLPALAELSASLREKKACFHHAPVFGAALRLLGIELADMQRLWLHFALRGPVSAGVRLGILGPYQAQAIQDRLAPALEEARAAGENLGWQDLAQTAPLLDLFQGNHDLLYSRLFQS